MQLKLSKYFLFNTLKAKKNFHKVNTKSKKENKIKK